MDFLKKRLKRLTSMGLALLLSASAFPATAFAASDSTSTLAEVTAKYIDAENGKEIAEQEYISVNTVKTHISNVYAKLGVCSRDELAQKLREELRGRKRTGF